MLEFFNTSQYDKRQRLQKALLCGMTALMVNSAHAMTTDDPKNTYVLRTGPSGAQRLDQQNEFLMKYSVAHLKRAGLSKGQVVWDVGCGSGAMTVYLAEEVGETGHVYAVDMSEKQLEVARQKIKEKGLRNVTFIQGDIRSLTDLPMGSADIVYTRYVQMHVKDPEKMIDVTRGLLKSGGVAVTQEPIMSSSRNPSEHRVFRDFTDTIGKLGKTMGVDYDIGARLIDLYKNAGYVNTSVEYLRPETNVSTMKKTLLLGFSEWKGVAIKANIITQEQADELGNTIGNWPDDKKEGFYLTPEQAYLIAKKE